MPQVRSSFTAFTYSRCELLSLTTDDLDSMSLEFPHIYAEILEDAHSKYQMEMAAKWEAIEKGKEAEVEREEAEAAI